MGPDVWLEGGLHKRDTAFGESLPGGPQYSGGPRGLGVIHLEGGVRRKGGREEEGGRSGAMDNINVGEVQIVE